MVNKTSIPILYKGVLYPSITHAAKAAKVSYTTMYHHLENGTIDDAGKGISHWSKRPTCVDGVWYPSSRLAANCEGISPSYLSSKSNRLGRNKHIKFMISNHKIEMLPQGSKMPNQGKNE